MLKNKVAVIYGSSGAPLARASPGHSRGKVPRVFLTGRNFSKVETVAKGIMDAGGRLKRLR